MEGGRGAGGGLAQGLEGRVSAGAGLDDGGDLRLDHLAQVGLVLVGEGGLGLQRGELVLAPRGGDRHEAQREDGGVT